VSATLHVVFVTVSPVRGPRMHRNGPWILSSLQSAMPDVYATQRCSPRTSTTFMPLNRINCVLMRDTIRGADYASRDHDLVR